ncbi:hypothetical protein GCM10009530_08350 [Microbispora corallina]|uniref:Lipoprotein n=1 Tax=Microbispora corallina TaxID=83302 RepID=A0ABQ4FVG0_9ACTN|nr:hypothetical protein [Microbispora corallina]GIH38798.1 hypothetical protein Mco01_17980 [Microbispora corallina]
MRTHVVFALGAALLLAGCTRTDTHRPVDDEARRRDQALVAVIQCFVDNRAIPEGDLRGQPWLVDGRVRAGAELVEWLSVHRDTVYGGRTLQTWENEATAVWPRWTCPL